jgi:xanthine/CO dehydrogenase XdhC/CoxF family maturation factor
MSLHRLIPLYERARLSDEPLVLATVIRTGGSTYAKPGAQMLIASDGEYAGLLSGGCLEGDLREHARDVAANGQARVVSYDLRSKDDQLFGIGAGCEGAMDIVLSAHTGNDGWHPLNIMESAFRQGNELRLAVVTASREPDLPLGTWLPTAREFAGLTGGGGGETAHRALNLATSAADPNSLARPQGRDVELFVAHIAAPPNVLLLGGGPDARPVATLAAFLGWRVTVVDHRPAYLEPARFPPGTRLVECRAADLHDALELGRYSAAIVMSHHLESDLQYLRVLVSSCMPYVGLLGPAARREKLLADLGSQAAQRLRGRLRAPVGLDIGGRTPESIALSIVGEVQAALAGRGGRPFTETANE